MVPVRAWRTQRILQMGCFFPVGAVWEIEGQRPKARAWIDVVVESQRSESSPEGHPAKRWVEGRNHGIKAKTKRVEDQEIYESGEGGWKNKEVVWTDSQDKLGRLVAT